MSHAVSAAARLSVAGEARDPDAPALVSASGVLTWGALEARIDAAARALAAHVEPGARVAICTSDACQEIVAAAAVLAAGGVFVPLEVDDPRLAARLGHCGARAVVTSAGHADLGAGSTTPAVGSGPPAIGAAMAVPRTPTSDRRFLIDGDGRIEPGPIAPSQKGRTGLEPDPDAPGCVLYRSSRDGRPLGIVLPRRALLAPVFGDELDLTPDDRVALPVGFTHETTCTAALRVLAAGAGVIDIGARAPLSPRAAGARLRDHRATVLVAPAPLVERLARQFPWALATIRLVLCPGGLEAPAALAALGADIRPRCASLYGSAETGGYAAVCWHESSGDTTVRTPAGTRILVLDENLAPVAEGEGQVCVASGCLALERDTPDGDARVFATHTVDGAAERIYLSGDLACRIADGRLRAAGRSDRRAVLHDLRIEPEEIEAALRQSPRIADARVDRDADGLAATVTPAPGERLDADEIGALLRASLPARLVPRSIVVASGEPQSDLEQALAGIWAEVLQRPHVGLHDNFFDLGGHSMKLVRVASLVQTRLGERITMVTLLAHPTIHKLAKHLGTRQSAVGSRQ